MLKSKRSAYLFFFILIAVYYASLILFHDNLWMRAFIASFLPIVAGLVSFSWTFKAYQTMADKNRYFWLLFSIGILFFTLFHFTLLFFLLTNRTHNIEIAIILLSAYFLFLTGLAYKIRQIKTNPNRPFFFNLIIFMTVVMTVSIHYIVNPILPYRNFSLISTSISLCFPVIIWSISFTITYLFYLFPAIQDKRSSLFIIGGSIILVIADVIYIFQNLNNDFLPGNMTDPLLTIAILIIGLGGLYTKEKANEREWFTDTLAKNNGYIFPYLSVMILLVLYLESTNWYYNSLTIGLCLTLFLIVGRQILLVRKNYLLIAEYHHLAYHDPLTGLYNRAKLTEDFTQLQEKMDSSPNPIALLLFDLDRFKNINDTFGHYIGDSLLEEVAKRLKSSAKENARIYRMGGDEFIFLLVNATKDDSITTAKLILAEFSRPFKIADYDITITPSIGISMYPENAANPDSLLKNADAAMYLAKEKGKNNYQFYCSQLNETMNRKMLLETELRNAIEKNQLQLYYQPKIDLKTRKLVGMEALLRWQHPTLGVIAPSEFIPIAEESRQIISIGEWVLLTACKQNKLWQNSGLPHLSVSVNVSVRQFQDSDFLLTVKRVIAESGLDPQYLELEITESIMQNMNESLLILTGLRKLGVKLSIDDFGTGYSSLHVLKELPIDTLKIDKSFIDNISDQKNQSMVKTIIDLGLNFNLNIVAEGIEHEHQAQVLSSFNCSYGQGYLFSKPIPTEQFNPLLIQIKIGGSTLGCKSTNF